MGPKLAPSQPEFSPICQCIPKRRRFIIRVNEPFPSLLRSYLDALYSLFSNPLSQLSHSSSLSLQLTPSLLLKPLCSPSHLIVVNISKSKSVCFIFCNRG
ncbi:hypothetical protein I3760_08G103900 [Carya illinoinensis]|nr:hypothetical protein I3760_08G103900 [Carya illinoinensis]